MSVFPSPAPPLALCGPAVLGPGPGALTSPGFPGLYPPGLDCAYRVTAPPGHRVRITSHTFELESSSVCRFDYLKVKRNKKFEKQRVKSYVETSVK